MPIWESPNPRSIDRGRRALQRRREIKLQVFREPDLESNRNRKQTRIGHWMLELDPGLDLDNPRRDRMRVRRDRRPLRFRLARVLRRRLAIGRAANPTTRRAMINRSP